MMKKDRIQLVYRFYGPEDKPLILFLHGFMGSGRDWEKVISLLTEHYRCLSLDLPGHGEFAQLNRHLNWNMKATADGVCQLLNNTGIRKCYMVGYSMGGRLALYLALHYPHYFSKVILESASPGLKTVEERKARIEHDKRLAIQLESGNFKHFLSEWFQQPLFRGISELPQFEGMLRCRLNNDPQALAKSLLEMGTGRQPSLWKKLPGNKIPLLLVVGQKDRKFRSIAEEIASICSAANVMGIKGCGHNTHFEAPERFGKEVEGFLTT
jgi:2-succinyl-6-hydroxy-2,4-cyclohexadiene-1-carboxylate synthase